MLVATQVWYTQQVEQALDAISKGKKTAMKEQYTRQVDQLTALIKMVQGDLPKDLRQKACLFARLCTCVADCLYVCFVRL